MLQIGDQLDSYQITAHMAQGGMSDIYRAVDLIQKREVVIKIPEAGSMGDPAQYERFQREMEVLTSLQHPSVLHGLASGKYNRIPYLVTELVEGRSLRELIDTSAPMPVEQAFELTAKIAAGLAYCHSQGIIHRDLKPENILVTPSGQPVIMDFGLALTKSGHRVTYSNLTATMGTPDYMAPEQVEGQRGDARTDIYSLGIILFEMLSAKTPFSGDNNMVIMAARLRNAAPRLDKVQPGLSRPVAAVVARCLQREPDHRFDSMETLITALKQPESVDVSILDRQLEPEPWWRSRPALIMAVSSLILVVMAALAFVAQVLRGP